MSTSDLRVAYNLSTLNKTKNNISNRFVAIKPALRPKLVFELSDVSKKNGKAFFVGT